MMPREIVKVETEPCRDCARLGERKRLTLSCGHVKVMRASQAPLAKTHCPACEQARQAKGLIEHA